MTAIATDKKWLQEFLQSSRLHLNRMDTIMQNPSSVERGALVAKEMNRWNFDLDAFMHFGLKIPFEKFKAIDKKTFKFPTTTTIALKK